MDGYRGTTWCSVAQKGCYRDPGCCFPMFLRSQGPFCSDFNDNFRWRQYKSHTEICLWVLYLQGVLTRPAVEMGTAGEIKSPEVKPATPVRFEMEEGNSSDHSYRRKRLGLYFMESDDRRTALGGGYTGGTTPVNIHGKPIADLSKTGGWIAAFFIFGTCLITSFSRFSLFFSPNFQFCHIWKIFI